jgi:hypothetical protein
VILRETQIAHTFVLRFACAKSGTAYHSFTSPFSKKYSDIVRHSLQRIINGRCYLIEVAQVDELRWRANILKLPGVPAAMMPFYGTTPDEAATNLTDWLDRANQPHAVPPPKIGHA